MSELKPCAHCGGKQIINDAENDTIHCLGCGAWTPDIETWNTRTPDHTALLRELVEALENAEAITIDHIDLLTAQGWTRHQAEEIRIAKYFLGNIQKAIAKAKEVV